MRSRSGSPLTTVLCTAKKRRAGRITGCNITLTNMLTPVYMTAPATRVGMCRPTILANRANTTILTKKLGTRSWNMKIRKKRLLILVVQRKTRVMV